MTLTDIIKRYKEKHGHEVFTPKAVLFDMDGVLYNSMPRHAIAWQESMQRHHIEMLPIDAYLYEGMRGVETIQKLYREQKGVELTDDEAQRIYADKSAAYAALGKADIMPGVKQLMQTLRSDGMTIGVVTGSGQKTLLQALEADFEGLVSRERMVTSFDVSIGKPHPMPYLRGLEKVHAAPFEAIVVENAPLGVRAAVAARIFTIAVNTGPLADDLLAREGADAVVGNMQEALALWNDLKQLTRQPKTT